MPDANGRYTVDEMVALANKNKRASVDEMVALANSQKQTKPNISTLEKASLALGTGTAKTLAGIARIASTISPNQYTQAASQSIEDITNEMEQAFQESDPSTFDKSLELGAEISTNIAAPEAAESGVLSVANKLSPETMEALKQLIEKVPSNVYTKTGGSIVRNIPKTAATSAIAANPDQSLSKEAEKGTAIQAGLSIAFPLAGKGYDLASSKVGNLISSNATAQQILERLAKFKTQKVIGGGEVPITGSEILGSDVGRKYQANVAPYIPFSTQSKTFTKINKALTDSANKIYQYLLGGKDPDYVMDDTIKTIKQNYFEDAAQSSINYHELDDYLEQKGLYMKFPNLKSTAKRLLDEYKSATKFHAPVLGNTDIHSVLENYSNLPTKMTEKVPKNERITTIINQLTDTLEKSAKPVTKKIGTKGIPKKIEQEYETVPLNEPIKYSKIAKNELNKISELENSAYRKGIYKELIKALNADIKNVTNKDVFAKSLAKNADSFYSKYVARYYDPEVTDFTIGNKHPSQVFKSFIKSGKNENPTKMEKFVKLLPQDEKKSVASTMFRHLVDKDGNINPYAMARQYKNLGQRTKDALFTKNEQKALQLLTDRAMLNQSAEKQLIDPATGASYGIQQTLSLIKKLAGAAAVGGAAATGGISMLHLASILAGNRALVKLLNNKNALAHIAKQQSGRKAGEKATTSDTAQNIASIIARLAVQ